MEAKNNEARGPWSAFAQLAYLDNVDMCSSFRLAWHQGRLHRRCFFALL